MTDAIRLEEAGLHGWKVSFHGNPEINGRRVCVLTSPDYCPIRKTGHLIARSEMSDSQAFTLSLTAAKEAINARNQ